MEVAMKLEALVQGLNAAVRDLYALADRPPHNHASTAELDDRRRIVLAKLAEIEALARENEETCPIGYARQLDHVGSSLVSVMDTLGRQSALAKAQSDRLDKALPRVPR
jgi:hypothetical protein